jgi:hypothetical protein
MAPMKDHNIITQTSGIDPDVLDCTPPLVVSEAEIDIFVNALDDVFERCKHVLGPVWEMGTQLMERSLDTAVRLPWVPGTSPGCEPAAPLARS